MATYKANTILVEAVQLLALRWSTVLRERVIVVSEITDWLSDALAHDLFEVTTDCPARLLIHDVQRDVGLNTFWSSATAGDYIIKGPNGRIGCMRPREFGEQYIRWRDGAGYSLKMETPLSPPERKETASENRS